MMKKIYQQPTMDTNYFIGAEPVMGIGHMKVIRRTNGGFNIAPGMGSNGSGDNRPTISPSDAM